ncbi:hypothetical protein ACEPAG_2398 [Sanghuangporus baumii]
MENSNQVPTASARPGQANSAKVQLGPDSFSTPKALKGNAFAITTSLLQEIQLGTKKQKREPIEKIKPGLVKEMKHAILLNVPDLIEKRLPDTLFQRLHQPQPNITVIDGSRLLPRVDSANDASTPVTNDGQDCVDTQHDLSSSTLLEKQCQANEGTATVEDADRQHLQNGGLGEKPPVEDSYAASVSEKGPSVDPHLPINLSHPSAPPSSTLSIESTARVPDIEVIFNHLSNNESEALYDDNKKKWIDWPDTAAQRKENDIASYLNKILGCIRYFLYGTRDRDDEWIFSSLFADKPIMDRNVCRKPDLALVRRKYSRAFKWEHIRGVAEIKTKVRSLRKIGNESSKYIREMFFRRQYGTSLCSALFSRQHENGSIQIRSLWGSRF